MRWTPDAGDRKTATRVRRHDEDATIRRHDERTRRKATKGRLCVESCLF